MSIGVVLWMSQKLSKYFSEFKKGASQGTRIEDSWAGTKGGIDCGSGGDGAGESNREKGRTTVTVQQ